MAVNSAREAVDNIISFINKNKRNIKDIIFTADWHPFNHCSFKDNGGQWPVHCVSNTIGAGIDYNLLKTVEENHIKYSIFKKGTRMDTEEYGADFNDIKIDDLYRCIVCGIAGDYCVKESVKNLLEMQPRMLLSGIASIDDGTTIKEFIKEHKLEVVE